jgi:hypothetical protein
MYGLHAIPSSLYPGDGLKDGRSPNGCQRETIHIIMKLFGRDRHRDEARGEAAQRQRGLDAPRCRRHRDARPGRARWNGVGGRARRAHLHRDRREGQSMGADDDIRAEPASAFPRSGRDERVKPCRCRLMVERPREVALHRDVGAVPWRRRRRSQNPPACVGACPCSSAPDRCRLARTP